MPRSSQLPQVAGVARTARTPDWRAGPPGFRWGAADPPWSAVGAWRGCAFARSPPSRAPPRGRRLRFRRHPATPSPGFPPRPAEPPAGSAYAPSGSRQPSVLDHRQPSVGLPAIAPPDFAPPPGWASRHRLAGRPATRPPGFPPPARRASRRRSAEPLAAVPPSRPLPVRRNPASRSRSFPPPTRRTSRRGTCRVPLAGNQRTIAELGKRPAPPRVRGRTVARRSRRKDLLSRPFALISEVR